VGEKDKRREAYASFRGGVRELHDRVNGEGGPTRNRRSVPMGGVKSELLLKNQDPPKMVDRKKLQKLSSPKSPLFTHRK